jgi:hypothetical protein
LIRALVIAAAAAAPVHAQQTRGGVGGIPGVTMVAKNSVPHGYTMCLGSNGHLSFAPAIDANLSFDRQKDLAPVSLGPDPARRADLERRRAAGESESRLSRSGWFAPQNCSPTSNVPA